MGWNYRVATKVFSYKDTFEGKNEELSKLPNTRLFSIIEVYYNEDGILMGYNDTNILSNWESFKDLKYTHKLIKDAFKKPIIDLDNYPNEYNL